MAEEAKKTLSSPQASIIAADTGKRKFEDPDLKNSPKPLIDSEPKLDPESVSSGALEVDVGGHDSETKRQRLQRNGDDVIEADAPGETKNVHQEEGKEKEESELPESADDSAQPGNDQEPVERNTEEPASSKGEETEIGSGDEHGQPKSVEEPNEEFPREGDVPVPSTESDDTLTLSRKMEVPNNKVGVLIGKAGDTVRSLQFISGAKIHIKKYADADLRSTTRPLELVGTLESINKAEKLIKDVIAQAENPLVARGFNTVQATCGVEQLEIKVSNDKVGLIIGKGGETIRNLQTTSGARIQLLQQNVVDGDQSRERTVRLIGNENQIEVAIEMIKDAMNQTLRPSPLSGGYHPRGPTNPQWRSYGLHQGHISGYDYPQGPVYNSRSSFPPPSHGNYPLQQAPRSNLGSSWDQRAPTSMYGSSHQGPNYGRAPPYSQAQAQSYGRGYNEHHAASLHFGHMGTHPTHNHGGPLSGHALHDQYGKPPTYGLQSQVPHSQPYGQPNSSLPVEVPYQGQGSSAQSYGQHTPQQPYPYTSGGPMQQGYPPYNSAPVYDGYSHTLGTASAPQAGQSVAGYSQLVAQPPPAYPQQGPAGGYGSYPGYAEQAAADNATCGNQVSIDPASGASHIPAGTGTAPAPAGYDQPSQTSSTCDQ